jgi:cobalt/nickel transport protein
MKKKILLSLALMMISTNALAHYQMVYTNEIALEMAKKIKLNLIFTHPFSGAYTMNMSGVDEVYVLNRKKKKDLKKDLKEVTYKDIHSNGKGYVLNYKARRMGDHLFVVKPTPYYDETTKSYIQQITKTVVNVAGIPSDWDTELGLEAEIVPLTKPYAIWAGSSFTGIVKSSKKIVPYAKIEVKYLNREINTTTNTLGKPKIKAPQDAFVNMIIKANKDGEFTFTIPKEGTWGFRAINIGTLAKYKGKPLEKDAVLWVQAKEMK